jgi:hypothetical protein
MNDTDVQGKRKHLTRMGENKPFFTGLLGD